MPEKTKTILVSKLKKGDKVFYQDESFVVDDVDFDSHSITVYFDDGQSLDFDKKDKVQILIEGNNNMKRIRETAVKGLKLDPTGYAADSGQDDGQPRDKFYAPTAMGERDVIGNILEKFSRAGVTYTFQGDDLMITAATYSREENSRVQRELGVTIAEVLKFLKTEYKSVVGKALSIGKEESSNYDCISNYTTNKLSLCRLTNVYELPDSKAADDAGSEQGELPGNILNMNPRVK